MRICAFSRAVWSINADLSAVIISGIYRQSVPDLCRGGPGALADTLSIDVRESVFFLIIAVSTMIFVSSVGNPITTLRRRNDRGSTFTGAGLLDAIDTMLSIVNSYLYRYWKLAASCSIIGSCLNTNTITGLYCSINPRARIRS